MRYGSICSGIEAASVAWEPLGWEPAFFSEIDPDPSIVLAARYGAGKPIYMPDPEEPGIDKDEAKARRAAIKSLDRIQWGNRVRNFGDFTQIRDTDLEPIDLLVGGTPCQDYSVAGLRAGLDGERGNLTLEFSRLAYRARPRWFLWENVPGVFSLNEGRDFGAILGTFSGRHGHIYAPPADGWRNSGIVEPHDPDSYGLAWRVLDLRHFGIPQRRRRVFIVGFLGDWRPAGAVLFERQSLSGDSPPRRGTRQGTAGDADEGAGKRFEQPFETANVLTSRMSKGINTTVDEGQTPILVPIYTPELADPIVTKEGETYTHEGKGNFRTRNIIAVQERAVSENPANGPDGAGFRDDGLAYTLEARPVPQAVAYTSQITSPSNRSNPRPEDPCPTLAADDKPPILAFSMKDHGQDVAEDCSPTRRAGVHDASHPNGGVPPAIAFKASHFTRGKDGAPTDCISPLTADADKGDQDTLILAQNQPSIAVAFQERGRTGGRNLEFQEDEAYALTAPKGGGRAQERCVAIQDVNFRHQHQNGIGWSEGDEACAVDTRADQGIADGYCVRRLTPRECERLQGFPDDWTRVPIGWRKEKRVTKLRPEDYWSPAPDGGWILHMADGPRYRMVGNSKGVPVVRWIGSRIADVDALIKEKRHAA